MHAREVEPRAELEQHHLSERGFWRWRHAVTYAVTTGDHDVCALAATQDLGQGAHEDVKAAIRLEIACDVGNHLIAARKCTSRSGYPERSARIGANDLR